MTPYGDTVRDLIDHSQGRRPRPDRRHLPTLFRHPPRPAPLQDDPDDAVYTLEITAVDAAGLPIAGAEISVVNNNNGQPSSRYSDGNGYTNHGLIGQVEDLITITTNGYKILAATNGPPVGPQYFYLPAGVAAVAIQLSLESFKRGYRPSPALPRSPLPEFGTPINYRTLLPWQPPPQNDRDFLRGDFWGVVMPNAPWVPGASTRHPERILTWFLDRYEKGFQEDFLGTYDGYGYQHLLLSVADSIGKIDNGVNSPPGNGRSLDEFIETCLLVKKYVRWCHVRLGSKYFQDFEGRIGNCPHNMSSQQWADWADPIMEALIAAKAVDEFSIAWEMNLWNTPGEPTINALKHAGQIAHAAGLSNWMHFGPHVTSWFADGDPRGRFGFYDDIAPDVDGINYQSMGAHWSHAMAQARIVDSLWQFGDRGNDVKFRFEEDYATFMWNEDVVTVQQDDQVDAAGNPVYTAVTVTPDYANQRGYIGLCTVDDVKHGSALVWGYGNGGRRPDGSRL